MIVSMHRHRREFDPALSLVAEVDGKPVGHALFSPRTIRLLDADVLAVSLGPIAVLPGFQGRGIGRALIEEGHRVAAAMGKQLSFLIGHRTYYPRFGYRTNAYGTATVAVPASNVSRLKVEDSDVRPDDVRALHDLWRVSEGSVDFAIDPGSAYLDWVSPNPAIRSVVVRREHEIVGYVRYREESPEAPIVMLARDADAARAVAAALARRANTDTLILPMHPRSAGASAFERAPVHTLEAAMALQLAPVGLSEYLDAIDRGARPGGCVIWPVEFDL